MSTPTPRRANSERLVQALRYEPCSANWLRYGIEPQEPARRHAARPLPRQGPPPRVPRVPQGAASCGAASGPARPSPTTVPTTQGRLVDGVSNIRDKAADLRL